MKPDTYYTKSGSINIAYQVFGSGQTDIVYIPGWVSNIDLMWDCPELVSFFNELGKTSRVILFDKRGTGLSDRVVELSTLEERMDDIRAVMDAVGSEKAVLFGHSEGGSVSALFAATYPNRTIALVAFGIFAKRRYAQDYPWAPTDEERQKVYDMIENSWGRGDMQLESLAPSKANDRVFMDWLANYFRSGASPSAAMVLTKMNTEVDIIDVLSSIKVPTLILQRTDDIDVKIEEGRFIADRIENARFVELEGNDHLFWVGQNTSEVLEEMKAFIAGVEPKESYDEKLFTIVAARIHHFDQSDDHKALITRIVNQYRGKLICYSKPHTFVAIFEGPSRAAHCSVDLSKHMRRIGSAMATAIHITEASTKESHFVGEDTARFIESVLEEAKPDRILVTQAVKYLLSGAGLNISRHGSIVDYTSGDAADVFQITDHLTTEILPIRVEQEGNPTNASLLENVLQCIEKYFTDETFGVDTLCKEVGISERQLQRKLKATTNKSPNQLISSVRLHRARKMLLDQKRNISEIAFQTGFSNPSYFSKCFKKEFGITPSELVQKLQNIPYVGNVLV